MEEEFWSCGNQELQELQEFRSCRMRSLFSSKRLTGSNLDLISAPEFCPVCPKRRLDQEYTKDTILSLDAVRYNSGAIHLQDALRRG